MHDQDLGERDPEMTGGNKEQEKDLETVMVAKLQRVQAEVVKARNQRAEMVKECEQFRKEILALEKVKADADAEIVIASLEQDLDTAISTSASPSKAQARKTAPVVPVSESNPAT